MKMSRKIAGVVGTISLVVLVPASGALADTTQPNACVGQSIHTIKSSVDATTAAQTATTQANADIQSTTTTGSK